MIITKQTHTKEGEDSHLQAGETSEDSNSADTLPQTSRLWNCGKQFLRKFKPSLPWSFATIAPAVYQKNKISNQTYQRMGIE